MKKFWALLLAALLVVSILPVSALAADVPEPTPAFEQGTLTINVAFNGLPEDKIPESVKWGLKKDGAHVQDVVITAAEKWTKSLTLDPGEYEHRCRRILPLLLFDNQSNGHGRREHKA